jgi:hypothetical protein
MGIKRGRELLHRLAIGVISGWRRKTMTWPGSGAHTSARERGKECTNSGFRVLGHGLNFGRARMVPQGLFPIFFCFLLFLFLFFQFLYNFCILNSNDFKPNAKVF